MAPKKNSVLTLVCPHYGEAFPSMMQMDRPTLEAIRLETVLEHCLACGKAASFHKGDNFFVPHEGQS